MKKNPTWQKTLSWLLVSYVLISLPAWYESGSLTVALLAALWASIIKTPVYSFHESLWGKVIFQKESPAPAVTPAAHQAVLCEACRAL